jgi:hypothetical protein
VARHPLTWERVAVSKKALRDSIGFLGVIVSLVFVGLEIRQNNRLAEAAAYQAIGVASAAAFDALARDRDFNAVQLKSPSEMDQVDWMQLRNQMTSFARLAETVWLQTQRGVLPESAWTELGFSGWGDMFDRSAPNFGGAKIACVWPLIRREVSPAFQDFVESGGDPASIDCSEYDVPTLNAER